MVFGFPIWYRSIIIAPDSNDASLHNSVHNTSNSTHLTSSRHVFDTRMQERNQEQRKKKPENDQGHTAPAQRKSVRGVGGKTGGTPGEIIANRKSRDNAILVVLSYEPKTKLISFSQVSKSRDRCISILIFSLSFLLDSFCRNASVMADITGRKKESFYER